jgi:hypothetical protein
MPATRLEKPPLQVSLRRIAATQPRAIEFLRPHCPQTSGSNTIGPNRNDSPQTLELNNRFRPLTLTTQGLAGMVVSGLFFYRARRPIHLISAVPAP